MIELNPLEDADIPSAEQEQYESGKDAGLNGEDIPSYTEDFDYLDYCFLLGWMDGMMEKKRTDVVEECKYKIVDFLEKQLGCKICSSYEEKYHCSKCEMQKTINSTVDILEQLKNNK